MTRMWMTGILLTLLGHPSICAPLLLEEVFQSTEDSHPLLLAAIQEHFIARGNVLEAHGAFDTKLTVSSKTNQFGYYKNRSSRGGVSQPIQSLGGEFFGGYERGMGNFGPWEEDRLTLSRGEWSSGIRLPLLRNSRIDERRTDLLIARLSVELADATVRSQRLTLLEAAASTYWEWVSAGSKLGIATALLDLAEDRIAQVNELVDAGQLAEIEVAENQRAVMLRRRATVSAERDLQAARFNLSLFLRDADGNPRQVGRDQLPEFPEPEPVPAAQVEEDLRSAFQQRPEIAGLMVQLGRNGADLRLARNQLRPELDFVTEFGRDAGLGSPTKRGSEWIAGITLSSPAQRREAKGQVAIETAKQEQLMQKLLFARDRVEIEVRDAASALTLALQRLDLARAEAAIAQRLASAEMERFELGDSTLFIVNLREVAAATARIEAVNALTECHKATAAYRAATAAL